MAVLKGLLERELLNMTALNEKKVQLESLLAPLGKVVVGFSGGIDSTLVLAEALRVLGKDRVLAVVANSVLFADEEYTRAISLAKSLKANVRGITIDYLANAHIAANEPETWYYSKQLFYQQLNQIAKEGGYQAVLDGMIMDDLNDFRPGLVARNEAGAISVLQKAGFYKDDVRGLAKSLGLHNWNKAASCSIASRFPYYTQLTPAKIKQVMQAEKYLRDLGFPVVRVRYHNEIARIEVPVEELNRLVEQHDRVQEALVSFGFKYVTVDMAGFKSGRMNDDLSVATKQRLTVKQK